MHIFWAVPADLHVAARDSLLTSRQGYGFCSRGSLGALSVPAAYATCLGGRRREPAEETLHVQVSLSSGEVHHEFVVYSFSKRGQAILSPIKNRRYSYRRRNIPYPWLAFHKFWLRDHATEAEPFVWSSSYFLSRAQGHLMSTAHQLTGALHRQQLGVTTAVPKLHQS